GLEPATGCGRSAPARSARHRGGNDGDVAPTENARPRSSPARHVRGVPQSLLRVNARDKYAQILPFRSLLLVHHAWPAEPAIGVLPTTRPICRPQTFPRRRRRSFVLLHAAILQSVVGRILCFPSLCFVKLGGCFSKYAVCFC
ncbi:unnamed protein product, partial [Ixodes pacificus]